MKVDVAGICGTDVKMYAKPVISGGPVIMGHENVGVIAKAGREFTKLRGVREGDRVFLEHYVPCYQCEWCHRGQYRHCEATDWRTNRDARRYGYTSAENPFHLWEDSHSMSICPGMRCCIRCPTRYLTSLRES